jgi:MFS transporter, DHA2 family, multidrug resistance protein
MDPGAFRCWQTQSLDHHRDHIDRNFHGGVGFLHRQCRACHIAGSLSASYDEATWIITSFLIATAIIIPISGWLADVVGRKRYYMISVALFTFASILCGLAPNLTVLIIARVLQGLGGGGLAPVEQSMTVDTFPPHKRGMAFAAYGMVVIGGPILGPTLGGWITDNLSWHWVFLINLPVGLLSLVLVGLYVKEPPAVEKSRQLLLRRGLNVDIFGFALVALFFGCLEVTLDRGQREDWFSSPMITSFAIACALAFVIFIPWELSRKDPIVRIRLFGPGNFLISNVFMLLMGVIIFGSTQFIPQFLQEVLGYTATNAGLALSLGGVAMLVAMPVSGFLTTKIDPRYSDSLCSCYSGYRALEHEHIGHADSVPRCHHDSPDPIDRTAVFIRADHQRRLYRDQA